MKNLFFFAFASVLIFVSCKKETASCTYTDSTKVAPQAEKDSVVRYLLSKNITNYSSDPSGVYYTISSQGTGTIAPNVCNYITVKYEGKTFSGVIIDATPGTSTQSFDLGQLIVGWQKALPNVKSGGNITLYIPPTLAYGPQEKRDANNNVIIPANSYLKFVIDLVQVQ